MTEKELKLAAEELGDKITAMLAKMKTDKVFGDIPFISDLMYALTGLVVSLIEAVSFSFQEIAVLGTDALLKSLDRVLFRSTYDALKNVLLSLSDQGGYDSLILETNQI
jgi:hypothetical protein